MKKEKNYTYKKLSTLTLKAKICGLQDLSKTIHASLVQKHGDQRMAEREVKKQLGDTTRHHLIAYALLRGKSYSSVEKNCICKPDPQKIMRIINATVNPWQSWTLNKVQDSLRIEQ